MIPFRRYGLGFSCADEPTWTLFLEPAMPDRPASSHQSVVLVFKSLIAILTLVIHPFQLMADPPSKVFRAGAFAADVTPLKLPVIINGNMNAVVTSDINDRLHARALVLDDGSNQIAIVIVDNCMMPRELLE